jgi:hypothetical protein
LNNPLRYIDPLGMAHQDANGNWVGDEDGEYDKELGLYWHAATQSWGDRQNSNAVNHIVGSSQEDPTNPGWAVLGTAAIATQADSPVPGPADLIAGGIAVYGIYKLATWSPPAIDTQTWVELIPGRTPLPPPLLVDPNIFSKSKHNKEVIWGLIGAAEIELGKLRNDPPEGGPRQHHKDEIKSMLDRAKNVAERLKGKSKEAAQKAIEAIEKEVAKH